jgi:ATP-binding cassette subfamily F protein 3
VIVLSVSQLRKAFGVDQVLEDVSFTLSQGERLGLVGVNGSGKSTLLRILSGELTADDGKVSIQKGMEVGYLQQSYIPDAGRTVRQEMEQVFAPLYALEQRLRTIEREMAHADEQSLIKLGEEYSKLQHRFEAADGYACRSRVQGVLHGLGFSAAQQEQQAALLSGGELTRLSLGRLLLQKPDLLLLDEPTNHLDLDALQWLEDYLYEYAGGVIVVSHDRYFLDRVCTGMVELLFGKVEQYSGNYTRYMEQRAERFLSRTRTWQQQQKEIERQQAIIARYRSFNREKSIRAAESREKALERMELVDRPMEEKQIRFQFRARSRMGDEALLLQGVGKRFGKRQLFNQVDLLLHAGDRAALIGANGIGKTTLLECLLGRQKQDAGSIRWGANADVGYYDQKLQGLHDEKTVLREVWDDFPRLLQHEVRGALGLFLFTGEDVFKPVGALSGGERARVCLTKLMLRHNNFLLMDEPTNHLDSDSREVLEDALEDFNGTILAVSHDRYFINRFANRILVLQQDGLRCYDGNYDDYLRQTEQEGTVEGDALGGRTRTEVQRERKQARLDQQHLEALQEAVRSAEENVIREEDVLQALEAQMHNPEVYAVPAAASELAQRIRRQKEVLEAAYTAWEQAENELQ